MGTTSEPVSVSGRRKAGHRDRRFGLQQQCGAAERDEHGRRGRDGRQRQHAAPDRWGRDMPAGTGTFTYDANGNLTAQGTKTHEWDAENWLTRVLDSGTGNRAGSSTTGMAGLSRRSPRRDDP